LSGIALNPEWKLIYRAIYKGDGQFQEKTDYRTASSLPSGGTALVSAAGVTFVPYGDIASSNVQAAIQELDDEKADNTDLLNYSTTGHLHTGVYDVYGSATGEVDYHEATYNHNLITVYETSGSLSGHLTAFDHATFLKASDLVNDYETSGTMASHLLAFDHNMIGSGNYETSGTMAQHLIDYDHADYVVTDDLLDYSTTGHLHTGTYQRYGIIDVESVTGTSYTFVIGDTGKYKRFSNASGCSAVVPTYDSVAFEVGTVITLMQIGAGTVTVSAAATGTTTLNAYDGLSTYGQYAGMQIVNVSQNIWDVLAGQG